MERKVLVFITHSPDDDAGLAQLVAVHESMGWIVTRIQVFQSGEVQIISLFVER